MKKQQMKALPRSKARNAYDLMIDVKKAIRQEPKRINMGIVLDNVSPAFGGPACGTVGCFAGWISVLAGINRREGGIRYQVTSLLGHHLDYQTVGRYGGCYVFNSGIGDKCNDTTPGTKAHANAVIDRINKFMKINKVVLKARKLKVTSKGLVNELA